MNRKSEEKRNSSIHPWLRKTPPAPYPSLICIHFVQTHPARQTPSKEPRRKASNICLYARFYAQVDRSRPIRTRPHSMSGTMASGFVGSNQATLRSSPFLAPTVTQTCLYGALILTTSLHPVHLSRPSGSILLFPRPPLVVHSLTTSRMNSIFLRKWFA